MRWLLSGAERAAPRIDWIETYDRSTVWQTLQPKRFSPAKAVDPRHPYQRAYRDGTGATLQIGQEAPGGQIDHDAWRLELPGLASAARPLDELLALPGKLSRLDIALDTQGPATPQWLMAAVSEGRVVTRWKTARYVGSLDVHNPAVEAWTCYIGRRGGLAMLRVYDRAALTGSTTRETRWELELRHHAATVARDDMRQHGKPLITLQKLLTGKLRVTEDRPDRTNTSRAKLDPIYEALFDADEPLRTTPPDVDPAKKTARRVRALKHLSRAMMLVEAVCGPEAIEALLQDGRARSRPNDILAIASARDHSQIRNELASLKVPKAADDEVKENPKEQAPCAKPSPPPLPWR